MEDAVGRMVAIIGSVFILFLLPLIIVTQKMDNTSQAYIDKAVVEFVDNARSTAVLTARSYEKLCNHIDSIQSNCLIKMPHSSKYAGKNGTEIEIHYYDYTKDDILNTIYTPAGDNQKYPLKNGDFVTVTVYNTKPTLGTQMYRLIMPMYDPGAVTIYSTYSGFVGNNPE